MSHTSSSSSSSPIWLYSYIKLRFFGRIRRFMRSKATTRKRNFPPSDHSAIKSTENDVVLVAGKEEERSKAMSEVVVGVSIIDDVSVLQRAVKKLHFGCSVAEKEEAAAEIGCLAKDDVRMRKLVGELGVIPVLVKMAFLSKSALRALIQLADGTYTNKALIVEAGILSKLPKNTSHLDEPTKLELSELLLTLSSLANTQFSLPISQIVPFLMDILDSNSSTIDAKHLCLATLYNLSTVLDNAGHLANSDGLVDTLLKLCSSSTNDLSEKALATLGNLVVTLMGKKAMENSLMVPESLIEILTWEDKQKCQESSAYILMILAHQSSAQRQKMAKLGIVAVLLEVSLLGSPLAQKRALKLLQWFKDERQTRIGPHSGPQTGRVAMGSPLNHREAEEGKKMMKSLVKQSLHKNMEMITRRANAAESSKLKALVISTSSKSLPY